MKNLKVYFDGNFWGHKKYERGGRELKVNKEFIFGGKKFIIPSLYVCSKGLVIDFCIRFEAEKFKRFLDKWQEKAEACELSLAEEEQLEAENPANINFNSCVIVNEKMLDYCHSSSICWYPENVGAEFKTPEAEELIDYYNLEKNYGWTLLRSCYKWDTVKKPKLNALSVTLSPLPVNVSSHEFSAKEGKKISFVHPKTKKEYVLTVKSLENHTLLNNSFPDDNCDYPRCFSVLEYILEPDMKNEEFFIRDIEKSETPRIKDAALPESRSAAAIGFISSACANKEEKIHHVCSSLYHEPKNDIKWQLVWMDFPDEKDKHIVVDFSIQKY